MINGQRLTGEQCSVGLKVALRIIDAWRAFSARVLALYRRTR